jgi:hypothetical protein
VPWIFKFKRLNFRLKARQICDAVFECRFEYKILINKDEDKKRKHEEENNEKKFFNQEGPEQNQFGHAAFWHYDRKRSADTQAP